MIKNIILNILLIATLLICQQQLVDSITQRIKISPNSNPVEVNAKKPLEKTITCQTEGAEPHLFDTLRWTGPNQTNNWEYLKNRHQITELRRNANYWKLNFINPTPEDSGTYYCFGTYHGVDKLNASINVLVYNPIEVSACPERQLLTKGSSNGKISCRLVGDEMLVTISKGNQTIEDLRGRYKWDNDDGLVINGEVDESDAGVYTISAYSEVAGQSLEPVITVEVQSKPEILPYTGSNYESEFYGIEGKPAELACKAIGTPKPLFYWFDPQRRNLTSVGGYLVDREKGTLTIERVKKFHDEGQFECVAYNSVGSTSRNVSMAVYTPPEIVNFDNKTVDEGAEVTFECRSTGEPEPKFSIRRQGLNQLPYFNGDAFFRRAEVIPEGGRSNVYVHKLTVLANRSQHGLHYCNATNRAGTAERYNHLFVNYKPDLSLTPETQFVKRGKPSVVTCHIKAYPPPSVTWWSDRTQIINVMSETETSPDNQVHIFKMTPPNTQQLAYSTFTCRAENHMGRASQDIKFTYITRPGLVMVNLMKRTPTTVELSLSVPNNGGDRIRRFIYKLEGVTLDNHNPTYSYRKDKRDDTELTATPREVDIYTIKNLLPYYTYRMNIRAVNDVDAGEVSEFNFETLKPTRPEPPTINKPSGSSLSHHSTPGYLSDYSNGYILTWNPPDLDNGEPITQYSIKFYAYDETASSVETAAEVSQQRIIEQMSERPLKSTLGPLETGHRYKIELRAINKYGPSEPASILIYTKAEMPPAPLPHASSSLAWLTEPSTPTLLAMLALGVVLLIVIDLIFCFFFQMGMSFKFRNWCCPSKAGSVISERKVIE